ncbi:hypothetical protein FA95DRAFT_1536850 [Auriscalpium vulgare]|uniref:Uncharacterized protein n=1 Tax=Auriscalpium vulgare TaxID=40419 RepID=A0ACB8S2F4_9AGAM|nr:hypothetical protein FA95DRAFT_1536850 [Auriscalpium vulgare]
MFFLKEATGPFAVGAATFTVPVRPPRVIGTAAISLTSSAGDQRLEPALRLEEVAFTAYYPIARESTKTWRKGVSWLMRPLKDSVRGYSHFTGVSSLLLWPFVVLFGARIKIPAYVNAPPLRNQKKDADDSSSTPTSDKPWPLVIFSHGLGGGSTTYSQLCTHLASTGKVVLALEHRDGTGPVCRPRSSDTGKPQRKLYISPDEVVWHEERDINDTVDSKFALRAEQLEYRRREVFYAYAAFRDLVMKGERGGMRTLDDTPLDWPAWTGGEFVSCEENVSLVGHSFGGATVFSILSNHPPEGDNFPSIPVSHALALDPWLEPVSSPGPQPVSVEDSNYKHPKLLVINAEGFTLWEDHFKRVLDVVPAWVGSNIFTIVRSQHVSFSDFPVLLPPLVRDATARPIMDAINALALAFIDDTLPSTLELMTTRKLEIRRHEPHWWSKRGKRELVGNAGDVIVHLPGVEDGCGPKDAVSDLHKVKV